MDDVLVSSGPTFPLWGYAILALLAVVAAGFIAWGFNKLIRYFSRPELLGMSREEIQRRWIEVRKTGESNGLMGAKLAILEADNLLDSGLKSLMMPGETLGERLKVACYKYPKLKDVWWAHKLRNQIAHESSFQVSPRQARQALDEFEKALKTLNIL